MYQINLKLYSILFMYDTLIFICYHNNDKYTILKGINMVQDRPTPLPADDVVCV